MTTPDHHSVPELAKALGLSRAAIGRSVRKGRIKAWRIPSPCGVGKYRIPHAEFLRLVVLARPSGTGIAP